MPQIHSPSRSRYGGALSATHGELRGTVDDVADLRPVDQCEKRKVSDERLFSHTL